MPSENIMIFVWLGLTIVFAIIEAATAGLATIWFAIGSLITMILAICSVKNIFIQIAVFVIVSVVSLIATRPFVKKVVHKNSQPTNADRCIGMDAVVKTEINNLVNTGIVSVNGNDWSAKSSDESIIETGAIVKVKAIEGVKLIVEK